MFDAIEKFAADHVPEHLQGLWSRDIETQLIFASGEKYRMPKDGNAEGLIGPYYDDHTHHPPLTPETVAEFGTSGWDYRNSQSLFGRLDLDGLNHAAGHDSKTLNDLVQSLSTLEEIEIVRSTSGQGYHATVYFDPEDAPRAATRQQHIGNIKQVATWLSKLLSVDLTGKADCVGVVCWLHNHRRGERGYEIVKPSTKFVGREWQELTFTAEQTPEREYDKLPSTPAHVNVADWLVSEGRGEWDGDMFRTHTYSLLLAAQADELKIKGGFATLATGSEGVADRNCWMFPDANGSWRVYRYHKGTREHESWWTSANGWTTTYFNRAKQEKTDPALVLVGIGTNDELFHDPLGKGYVTTKIRGIRETMPIADSRYKSKLRLEFTSKTGAIVSAKILDCAVSQLNAIATLERAEYPVSVRMAEHEGNIYVDLANRERQVVEVTKSGWSVVEHAPVRFVRPYGLLPLPTPIRGGTLKELRKYVNVDDDELPLLLAFIVSCFHPTGPYALLSIVGEQGSAKTALLRFLHDLIDPQMGKGAALPKNERDLLAPAQFRRLVSFDNVDSLDRKTSSLLCTLCTGATSSGRKLFTDGEQAIMVAKKPIVITSIGDVVKADDLLDRTISLLLPAIPATARKTEFAIEQELRRDGARGRTLGYILDGVVASLAGHAKVKREEIPRMADVFTWALAAEKTYGCASMLDAYKLQQREASTMALDESHFAKQIIKLCEREKGYEGKASDIQKAFFGGMTSSQVGSQLREIAPNLRRQGYLVEFPKSNADRRIRLSKAS